MQDPWERGREKCWTNRGKGRRCRTPGREGGGRVVCLAEVGECKGEGAKCREEVWDMNPPSTSTPKRNFLTTDDLRTQQCLHVSNIHSFKEAKGGMDSHNK